MVGFEIREPNERLSFLRNLYLAQIHTELLIMVLQASISTCVSPQEIAKRLQEEEEQRIRRSRGQEGHCEGTL